MLSVRGAVKTIGTLRPSVMVICDATVSIALTTLNVNPNSIGMSRRSTDWDNDVDPEHHDRYEGPVRQKSAVTVQWHLSEGEGARHLSRLIRLTDPHAA